ncbi:MAG: hypothetical protein IPO21_11940 [Bacteroidales bacterium]|nr:hypothetical protein [Bacteroidales bacterium]
MRYILIFFMYLFLIQGYSQKSIKLLWGSFYQGLEDNKQIYYLGCSHKDSSNVLFINNALDLVEYNKNLEQVHKSSLKKSLKSNRIIGTYQLGKKVFIITVSSKGEHYIQKFDTASYTFKDEVLLFTAYSGATLKLKYSPDSSKVLFYNIINEKGITHLDLAVLTEKLVLKWQKKIALKYVSTYFQEPVIDNAGNVFYCDTDGKYLLINGITNAGSKSFEKTIAYKGTKMLEPVLFINKDILFVVQGYRKENIQFDCVTDIDIFQYNAEGTKTAEYNYAFKECLKDLQITNIYVLENKDVLIISELLSTKTSQSSNQLQYGSLYVMRFNLEKNAVLWEREIFKNHYYVSTPDKFADKHSLEYQQLHSHKMYEYKNELLFVYNDNCNNCMTNANGIIPKSHSDLTNSCLNMVSIDENGKVIRNIYSGKLNVKFSIMMNNCIRISEKQVIVFAVNQQFRLGRLYLD